MRKKIIITVLVFSVFLNVQCSKKKINQVPSASNLIYPTKNLLCIENKITFKWDLAIDPENDKIAYNIIVATDRGMTNIVENSTTSLLQATITLVKQTAYYWKVEAIDVNNNQGTASEIFAFFTKGEGVLNYTPYASSLISPANNGVVNTTSVNLTWDAADANTNDILTYELFFGENSTLTLINDSLTQKSHTVTVQAGKTYSWKVNVKDQKGAKSIGQEWHFTVN